MTCPPPEIGAPVVAVGDSGTPLWWTTHRRRASIAMAAGRLAQTCSGGGG